jgi:hypothetical protein
MPKPTDTLMETALMTKYYRGEYAHIIGRTIVDVRAMYPEEMNMLMWYGAPGSVITMDNGAMVVPMMDEEGNGAGSLMIQEGK